ncbi:MAG: Gfo/Idh/MocA family oxidoreductase [Candidatus Hydrogenedentes bacterium]|nr:Gfo/Idh/MocA family oxidoreductase [Candidatus Hydrogenedentota bacterium]
MRTSGAALGAGAWSLAYSRRVSAIPRTPGPNDRIVLGFIGVGGMGRSHFDRLLAHPDVHIAAVADPDSQRQQDAKAKAAESKVAIDAYTDFRELLERDDIDAVFVATPDHWHALAATSAMQAGKDVYCEKPLALTIAEGRAIVDTSRRYGRVCQMGTQQRSDWWFRHACEVVRNGRIGQVTKAVCFFGSNPYQAWQPDEEPPATFDWNLWLGPAPWRPFNRAIQPYNFRYVRDYSGGMLTDWGVHLFDIAQWGLGKDATSPKRVEAQGRMYADNMYEFPKVMQIQYDYGDVQLEWVQGADENVEQGQGYGTKFFGSDGEVFVNRGGYRLHPKSGITIDENIGGNDLRLYESPGHHQDFFNCMRTRTLPICDVATGHRSTCISHLGNISFRLGRPLEFDPDAQRFVNDDAANHMLEKPMRAPWHL